MVAWWAHLARCWPWLLLEGVAVLAILDIAAGLRLWHLGSLPQGIWFDEVDTQVGALRAWLYPFQPLGLGNVDHNPSLYFYAMAVLIKLFGDTISVLRLTSVCFGLLAVVAVYIIGRGAGGAPLGLAAAALLAIGDWAIDFSRIAMPNMAAPATIGASFAAFTMAMCRPRPLWFALAGMLLGLALMSYEGAFTATVVAIVVAGFRMLIDSRFRRSAWPAVLLLPLGFVAGAAPWFAALKLAPDYTLARINQVSLLKEYSAWPDRIAAFQGNLRKHLLMLMFSGDSNGRHNLPGAPMLDAVTGACLLLGLGICLRRFWNWFYLLLLLWLGASLLGGALSLDWEAPQAARTIGAIAPIALIAALPLAVLARYVWLGGQYVIDRLLARTGAVAGSELSLVARGMLAAVVAAAVTAVPLGDAFARNYDGYFVRHAHDVPSWNEMGGRQVVIGQAAAALAKQGYEVRVSPTLAGDPALTFAAGGIAMPAFDPNVPVPLEVLPPGLALIMPVDDADTLALVRRSYPDAPVIKLTPNFDQHNVQAYAVLIRQQDISQNLGVDVRFTLGSRTAETSHVQGFVPWPPGSDLHTGATIRGTLLVDKNLMWQPLAIRVQGAQRATLTIDGQEWRDTVTGTGTIRLGAGNHDLVVQAVGKAAPSLGLEWTAGNGTTMGTLLPWQPIPPLALAAPSLPTGGLLGLYFQRTDFTGPVALAHVDQQVNTYFQNPPPNLQFPFSARWLGTLRTDRAGLYTFKLDSTGPSVLYIDGKTVPEGTPLMLSSGLHALRLDYTGSGSYLHCYFTWQPPGQSDFAPVPPSVTEPAIWKQSTS
jgi:4-amino-4-deoxy-L-arabinose transferase-like glycosyltransferase